jgi:hypothetical protein
MEDQEWTGTIIGGTRRLILIIENLSAFSPLTLNRGLARSRSLGPSGPSAAPNSYHCFPKVMIVSPLGEGSDGRTI